MSMRTLASDFLAELRLSTKADRINAHHAYGVGTRREASRIQGPAHWFKTPHGVTIPRKKHFEFIAAANTAVDNISQFAPPGRAAQILEATQVFGNLSRASGKGLDAGNLYKEAVQRVYAKPASNQQISKAITRDRRINHPAIQQARAEVSHILNADLTRRIIEGKMSLANSNNSRDLRLLLANKPEQRLHGSTLIPYPDQLRTIAARRRYFEQAPQTARRVQFIRHPQSRLSGEKRQRWLAHELQKLDTLGGIKTQTAGYQLALNRRVAELLG